MTLVCDYYVFVFGNTGCHRANNAKFYADIFLMFSCSNVSIFYDNYHYHPVISLCMLSFEGIASFCPATETFHHNQECDGEGVRIRLSGHSFHDHRGVLPATGS